MVVNEIIKTVFFKLYIRIMIFRPQISGKFLEKRIIANIMCESIN